MASAKHKERTLKELFTVTQLIIEPEITPVLKGSCQMQGPADEIDCDVQSNPELTQDDMRTKSGTCNVCSAPCSSCLHINRALMGSKTNEFSDETGRGNAGSQYSVTDEVAAKSNACESRQYTASDVSNLFSVNSSYGSLSENAESKASLRSCDFSGASEDVEMHQNISSSGTATDGQIPLQPQCISNQSVIANKFEDQKGVDGHEDSISCVSGGGNANKLSSCNDENIGRKKFPHGSASAELSSDGINLIEIHSSKDRNEGVSSSKLLNTRTRHASGKSHSCNPIVKDLEEDLGDHLSVELPECSKEHLNPSLTKEAASSMVCTQRSASHTSGGNRFVGNPAATDKNCLNLEAETKKDTGSGDLPSGAVNSLGQIEEIEKVELLGLPYVQETSLHSQPGDDSDESDILEHDVKVCDICGDAGREDLLAICSRCSDGAEHTYCMREMVDKVPDYGWLCEECKFDDEIKDLRQDKIVTMDENSQPSGMSGALDMKLVKKDSDVEGNKTKKDSFSTKASGKRPAEIIEVGSAVKRQAIEATVGSPKTSSPVRGAALSRESSFRNLDKGKVNPVHQLSSGTSSINNTSEAALSPTGPRLQAPRGSLLKSNSFSSANVKPKVQPFDEVVYQKQKSAREPGFFNSKEGAVRLMGKSMSFKSVNPGRINPSESKSKMVSPKFSHSQDLKGLKQAKERNLFEKKNSFKKERPSVSSVVGNSTVSMLKGEQKPSSYGESYSHPSASKNHETKGVQCDGKLSTLSKSTSDVARRGSEVPVPSGIIKSTSDVALRGSEVPVPSGEVKRQSCLPSVAGASLTNGISSSAEQKPSQDNHTGDPLYTTERPSCAVNESLPDVLPGSRKPTKFGERIRESSVSHSRSSLTNGGRSAPSKKCKETGNSTQFCTVDSPQSPSVDASAARCSKEEMNKGNELKAAIEAAMLKKPGISRKSKMPDQSDDSSMSSTNLDFEIRCQDQSSTLINTGNVFSADDVHEGQAIQQNSTAESCKPTTVNNLKLLSPLPPEAATLKNGDTSPIVPLDGKTFTKDFLRHASTAVSVLLKTSAIPDHEYIWQGGFEVRKSGKLLELRDGIQAHLSTCASPKVFEVVNKFPSKILLNEVPRMSTWPVRFQETGVKEDNIALYFFAKDLESYEKSYKSLLETVMKGDLALKGSFDGVELLIFPSNHLPEKSQRWNMLYFLWGVFRGKKLNCSQIPSDSLKCSRGPTFGDIPMCSKACNTAVASEAPAPIESPCLLFEATNRNYVTKASSLDLMGQCLQGNVGEQDCSPNATSSSGIQRTSALSFQETRCTSTPLEENTVPECKLDVKPQSSVQAAGTIGGSKRVEKTQIYVDISPDIHQVSSHSADIVTAARVDSGKDQVTFEKALKKEEVAWDTKAAVGSGKGPVTFEMTLKKDEAAWDTKAAVPESNTTIRDQTVKDRVTFEKTEKKEEAVWDTKAAVPERNTTIRDQTINGLNNWQFYHGKPLHEDSKRKFSLDSGGMSPISWNDANSGLLDGGCASKKQRSGFLGSYASNSSGNTSFSREGFTSGIYDVGTGYLMKGRAEGACSERDTLMNNGTAERYFFPVDPHPVKENPVPWKVLSTAGGDDYLPGGAPNLELALGADMKPSKQGGILPFLLGKVEPKDGKQGQPPENPATKTKEEEEEEEEVGDVSACLSLSLSFAFPDKKT